MSPARAATSVVDVVAAALRERILDGDLPPGERLVEGALAADHDVARHTVRAALRVLAAERLVVVEPHRGARVAALEAGDVTALYELRTALEVEAAHLALSRHEGRLPPAVHEAAASLAARCRVGDPRWVRVSEAHTDLHAAIVRASGARRIIEAHGALAQETRLFLLRIRPHLGYARLASEHEELVADLERVGPRALRAHLRASAAVLVDQLA
ncbi:GntR family transcriptional regulator [Conexibacter sp. SYSU D00693]|uniref:GntR family transcriptional regulator n=1 Tax=Conexibacter sp. SYSU D00693 TaxID=2812560 RepID=UPI00196B45ED|nr:GntR family transcriptional regulator [Conexibacter sp. SYSU D00693]